MTAPLDYALLIKQIRSTTGFTQEQLASELGVTFGTVNGWENGKHMVHPVNGEVPPVKGRPWKLPHYANRGKTSSSGGELASARSCLV